MKTKRHTLLIGPPGSGKTLWARARARKVVQYDERKVAAIYTLAGLDLHVGAPFRAPHHTVSNIAMQGRIDFNGVPRPGELALAYSGTLFLDEVPEFSARALNEIAQAVVQHYTGPFVTEGMSPHPFRLIMATNPCPCGWHGYQRDHGEQCACTDAQIQRYASRIPEELRNVCEVRRARIPTPGKKATYTWTFNEVSE